jgi:hypothetical protein
MGGTQDVPAQQLDLGLLRDTITGQVRQLGPQVTTPISVREARRDTAGLIVCDVDVCWLVPLASSARPDICIPAPTEGRVRLTGDGSVDSAEVSPPGTDVEREVRAWAEGLLANGAVRGVPPAGPVYGPPPRPTHELHEESGCRQVLRRIGYTA